MKALFQRLRFAYRSYRYEILYKLYNINRKKKYKT